MSIQELDQAVNRFGTTKVGDFLNSHTSVDGSTLIDDPDVPSGTIEITDNGEFDVSSYALANVSIEQNFALSQDYTVEDNILTEANIAINGDVDITIPNGVTEIGASGYAPFQNNTIITNVSMPDSVTVIGDYAFDSCTSLEYVNFSNELATIGIAAFYGCNNLNIGALPDSVTYISQSAFENCTNFDPIALPENLTTADTDAFKNTGIQSITFPSGISGVADGLCSGCTSLHSVNLDNDNISSIGENAFVGCSSLGSVYFPDIIATIGESAFEGCANLTSASFNTSTELYSIGAKAFKGTSIESIIIGGSMAEIGDEAFANTSLTDIYYIGTQANWETITIGTDAIPQGATIHYEYTPE